MTQLTTTLSDGSTVRIPEDYEEQLLARVLRRYAGRPGGRPVRFWGARGGATRRKYVCYFCGDVIDTESASYPMTKHAAAAIDAHGLEHAVRLVLSDPTTARAARLDLDDAPSAVHPAEPDGTDARFALVVKE